MSPHFLGTLVNVLLTHRGKSASPTPDPQLLLVNIPFHGKSLQASLGKQFCNHKGIMSYKKMHQ